MPAAPSPGFLDLHIHGAFGVDVVTADAGGLDRLAKGLEARGVTGFLPTLVPLPLEEMRRVVKRISSWMAGRREGDGRGALPLGIHFEGPFVSPARAGALHREALLDGTDEGSVGTFFEIAEYAAGRRMTTVAPEIPGGLELVAELARRGFVVAIGHTEADVRTLEGAAAAGARHMTPFGNAMKPLHHRDVGPVGWGLANDAVTLDVIADLQHLSPDMLRLVWKVKGGERVALISDALPAAGLPDGDYTIWGETLRLRGGTVRNAAGGLAGSAVTLEACVDRLAACGIPPDEARRSAAGVPRRVLGL